MMGGSGGERAYRHRHRTRGEVEEDDRNCIPSRISINYPAALAFAIYLSIRAHRTRNESKNQNKYADTLVLCVGYYWIGRKWKSTYSLCVVSEIPDECRHHRQWWWTTCSCIHTHMCPVIHTHPAHCMVQG